VVLTAEQHQVVEVGMTSGRPWCDVVGMEEPGATAAGMRAATVAAPQRVQLAATRPTTSPPEIEGAAVGSVHSQLHSPVAGEHLQNAVAHRWSVVYAGWAC